MFNPKINKDLSRGFKIKLYPTEKQKEVLNRQIDLFRFVYNWGLNEHINYYKENGSYLKRKEMLKKLSEFRNSHEWMKDIPLHSARLALAHLDQAFANFFNGKGFPKFKTKKRHSTSKGKFSSNVKKCVHYRNESYAFYFENQYVRLPGFPKGEKILCKSHKVPMDKDRSYYSCTVTFDGKNYWLSVNTEVNKEVDNAGYHEQSEYLGKSIGIDLGIRTYAQLSTGKAYYLPERLIKLERRRRRQQSRLMKNEHKRKEAAKQAKTKLENFPVSKRMQKLSDDYYKTRTRMLNIRNSFLQETTTEIANTYPDRIVMEDLSNSDFIKWKYKDVDEIYHANWYRFREILKYKCQERDIEFILAARDFPSSQICSCCGNRSKSAINVRTREYICKVCGMVMDRDLNAAINLSNYYA